MQQATNFFWGFMIFLAVSYIVTITCIMMTTKKTWQESNSLLAVFLSNCISGIQSANQPIYDEISYPTVIGFDGVNISSDYVQESFRKVGDYFNIWYFEYATRVNNCVIYYFKVYDCRMPDNRQNMLMSMRHIGEQALTKWLHECGTFGDSRKLIAVNIRANTLVFSIALNEKGLEEVEKLKKGIH